METRTTDKDLHWLYDDEAISPLPPTELDTTQADVEAPPAFVPNDRDYSEVKPAYATSFGEVKDGDFTEEIDPDLIEVDGEVVDNPPKPRGIPIRWLVPIGIGALLIALTVLMVVLPIFTASATIIITPDKQTLSMEATLSTPARQVLNKSLTLSQTVKTTGKAHQNASVSRGAITFYNALPSPQDIPQGTLITGADGMGIVTDADAYIPAGALSVNGQVTVSAHTTTTGAGANIQAGDISGACCRDYVFARNNQFTGGADARDYQTPTRADIQTASKDLTRTLIESMTSEAKAELEPSEEVLPPQCHNQTTSSTPPGIEANQTTVTLTSTCTVYGYSKQELIAKEEAVFNQAVVNRLGSGYILDGGLTQKINEIQTDSNNKNVIEITGTLTGACKYTFTHYSLFMLQKLIAGKTREQATSLLLATRGVRIVGIQVSGGGDTLPQNPQASNIVILAP